MDTAEELGLGLDPGKIVFPEVHLDSPVVLNRTNLVLWNLNEDALIQQGADDYLQYHILRYKERSSVSGWGHDSSTRRCAVDIIPRHRGLKRNKFPIPCYRLLSGLLHLGDPKISSPMLATENRFVQLLAGYNQQLKDLMLLVADRTKTANTVGQLSDVIAAWNKSEYRRCLATWMTIRHNMRQIQYETGVSSNAYRSGLIRVLEGSSYKILITSLITIIYADSGSWYTALSPELVLMITDTIESRCSMLLFSDCEDRWMSMSTIIRRILDMIDSMFPLTGNKTYEVIGCIEALVQATILKKETENPARDSLWEATVTDLLAIEGDAEFTKLTCELVEYFDTVVFSLEVKQIAELMALYRLWGHPHLDAAEACSKVRSYMESEIPIDMDVNRQIYSVWFSLVVNGYQKRNNGLWPPMKIDENKSPDLARMSRTGGALLPSVAVQFAEQIDLIEFEKFQELRLDENLSIFLKDRAIAPSKRYWDSIYSRECMPYNPPKCPETRRLAEYFINDTSFDPMKYVEYVTTGDYLADRNFNVSYSLKEREVKIAGRLFAKMTVNMRAAQTIHEHLLATGIGQYFEANGMVKDDHQLLAALHKMSAQSSPGITGLEDTDYVVQSAFLTTDIKKYCLSFRSETMERFATACDEIYGLPGFFNWQHNILRQSQIYVADPYCPPSGLTKRRGDNPPLDGNIVINGPLGGIEGYQQKGWTLFSIAALQLAAVNAGVRVAALVQGDNQIAGVTIRLKSQLPLNIRRQQVLEKARIFACELARILISQGQILKDSETIISHSMFVYSKRIMYQGGMLPQSLKAACRVNLYADTLLDDIRSALSSISTGCTKVQNQGGNPFLCMLVSLLFSARQLSHFSEWRVGSPLPRDLKSRLDSDPDFFIRWLFIPSHLGGFSYYAHTRLMVRNIGDPLVAALADLKRMREVGLLSDFLIERILNQPRSNLTWAQWAADPYGLNIPSTMTLSKIIEDITQRSILSTASNPMLKDLFHPGARQEDELVAEFFMNREVIMPRVAHAAIEGTPTGERKKLAALIDTTKTVIIQSLKRGNLEMKLLDNIMEYENTQIRALFRIVDNTSSEPWAVVNSTVCSTTLAEFVRNHSWYPLADGRPIKGLEVPDLCECCTICVVDPTEGCEECNVDNKSYIWACVPMNAELDTVSSGILKQRTPYFGSTTSEKTSVSLLRAVNLSRSARRGIRLATIITWIFGRSEPAWNLAHYFARTRANISLDELKCLTPLAVSANINHRLHESSTQMSYNFAREGRATRYILISTDNFRDILQSGDDDTNFIYQSGMLMLCASVEDHFRYTPSSGDSDTIFHLHVKEHCCVKAMPADDLYNPVDRMPPIIPVSRTNMLIYDPNPLPTGLHHRRGGPANIRDTLYFGDWTNDELEETGSAVCGSLLAQGILFNEKSLERFMTTDSERSAIVGFISEFLAWNPWKILRSLATTLLLQTSSDTASKKHNEGWRVTTRLARTLHNMSRANLNQLKILFSHPEVRSRVERSLRDLFGNEHDVIIPGNVLSVIKLIVSTSAYILREVKDGGIFTNIVCSPDDALIGEITLRKLKAYNRLFPSDIVSRYINPQDQEEEIVTLTDDELINLASNSGLELFFLPATENYILAGCMMEWKRRGLSDLKREEGTLPGRLLDMSIDINKLLKQAHSIGLIVRYCGRLSATSLAEWWGTDVPYFDTPKDDRGYLLRRTGIDSSSHYKLWPLWEEERGVGFVPRVGLFLAEGSGSIMTSAKIVWPGLDLSFNTLLLDSCLVDQRVTSLRPTEFDRVAAVRDDFKTTELLVLCDGTKQSTDLSRPECFDYIMRRMSDRLSRVDLITCDAEAQYSLALPQRQDLYLNVIELARNLLSDDGRLLIKILRDNEGLWHWVLSWARLFFRHPRVVATGFKNITTEEYYLVCSGPRREVKLSVDKSKIPCELASSRDYEKQLEILNDLGTEAKAKTELLLYDMTKVDKLDGMLVNMGFKVSCTILHRYGLRHDDPDLLIKFRGVYMDELVTFMRACNESTGFKVRYKVYNTTDTGVLTTLRYRLKLAYEILRVLDGSHHMHSKTQKVWTPETYHPPSLPWLQTSENAKVMDQLVVTLRSVQITRPDQKGLWKLIGTFHL